MDFDLDRTLEILDRTPSVLLALLSGVSPAWIEHGYGEGTFSPFDVVGHLITGEKTDWMVRVRIILDQGVGTPFPKYDRYAHFDESRGKTMSNLLDEFERLRTANLAALRGLSLGPADFAKRGQHPALREVTLENLLATWAVHDLNHLAQIARGMAAQYEKTVGPWKAYLGIFKAGVTRMEEEGLTRMRRD